MALYAFGSNLMSQLGLSEEINKTHTPISHPFFENKTIKKVTCGKLHTLVLTADNNLYSWGVNDDCSLGREGNEEIPEMVEFSHKIIDICAGASFSALLTDNGHVYACGTFKSTSGILGFSAIKKFQPVFTKYKTLKGIKKIAAGHNHILMVDDFKSIWVVGANESQQLGKANRVRTFKKCLEPDRISVKKRNTKDFSFVDVSAGKFHSFAINEMSNVYGWGSNQSNQLGYSKEEQTPVKMPLNLSNVTQISCGALHSLFITKEQKLFGCGDNSMHQLGLVSKETTAIIEPKLLLENVLKVKSGCDFTIAQIGNKLYGAGSNLNGEVGFGDNEVQHFKEINFDFGEIVDFDCGANFTIVVTK